jgi:prevent-host-death family protein
MQKMSLAHAKARISELVDAAEHHRRRTIILRHGKPAAAIVPVDVAIPTPSRAPVDEATIERNVLSFIAECSAAEPEVSAVEDLLRGRR